MKQVGKVLEKFSFDARYAPHSNMSMSKKQVLVGVQKVYAPMFIVRARNNQNRLPKRRFFFEGVTACHRHCKHMLSPIEYISLLIMGATSGHIRT